MSVDDWTGAAWDDRPLSPSAAACLLLVWQEPTDRALAGWCPFPGHDRERSVHTEMQWLTDKMKMETSERQSHERMGNTDICQTL